MQCNVKRRGLREVVQVIEVYAYSKAKDGNKPLSANFTVGEFACRDGSDVVFVSPKLVMVLQCIRSYFNAQVKITSGYRTPQYNKLVGGATNSQHCYGMAADIIVEGISVQDVASFARKIMPDWGGVGLYIAQGFTHIDVREMRADWQQ